MTSNLFAIVLAAGSASRFGSTKQLAEVDGLPMARRAIQTAKAVCGDRTILVIGHDRLAVAESCQAEHGFVVVNENFSDGLGSSISAATRCVRHVARAVLIILADQPLVTAEHLQALIDSWSGATDEIVATSFAGTQGPPVLFPAGCFDELAELTGDRGGRHLFDDQRFRLRTIVFEPASIDIDTPEDLTQI